MRNHPAALSPRIKSLNYLNNILAKIEGLQAGCIEALMLNHKGEVAECTGDNIFLVRDGVLLTPPTDAGILEGITRDAVIELARAGGHAKCARCPMTKHDVYIADECFLTGTAAEVIAVVKVDSRTIGGGAPGPDHPRPDGALPQADAKLASSASAGPATCRAPHATIQQSPCDLHATVSPCILRQFDRGLLFACRLCAVLLATAAGRRLAAVARAEPRRRVARDGLRRQVRRRSSSRSAGAADRQRLQRADRGRRPRVRHRSRGRAEAGRTRALLRLEDRRAAVDAQLRLRLRRTSATRPARGPACTVDDGRAYSLGSMGHLFCFDAATGKVLWSKDLQRRVQDSHADLGHRRLAPGRGRPGDRADRRRRRLPGRLRQADRRRRSGGRSTTTRRTRRRSSIEQAGRRVLVCWTGDSVVGLERRDRRGLLAASLQAGQDGHQHRHAGAGEEPAVLHQLLRRLADARRSRPTSLAVEPLWRRSGRDEQHTDSLHSIISTPYLEGDYVYGVDSYGEFRCLDAKTGDRVWESLQPTPKSRWSTIHMVRNGERMWMFNERGELIIATLSPQGYEEISRAKLIEPTRVQLPQRGGVCWSHPAFANRHVFARNDEELVCASLAAGEN